VLTSKRPQERSALKAEQIRQWMLIDHLRTLCRARLDAQRFSPVAAGPCAHVPVRAAQQKRRIPSCRRSAHTSATGVCARSAGRTSTANRPLRSPIRSRK
jgi:hypothetical protein